MDFIYEKINVMVEKLKSLSTLEKSTVEYEFAECPEYKKDNTPPDENAKWKQASLYERFYGIDTHYWIRFNIKTGSKINNAEPRLTVKTGREGQWDSQNPQFTVFINGETTQALDTNHTWIPLEFDKEYSVYMYLYTGMLGGDFGVDISLDIVDLKIESLYYDIYVPFECMKLLNCDSSDYITIKKHLDKALLLLDLREFYSDDFYESVDKSLLYLKNKFYEKECDGDKKPVVNCVGHTHIDVAYMWTVMQTREKTQRSFSTVLNLMKRYNDYIFMSSQPQLYQYVKENDPELYEKIKKRIKENRWEAEGAMWLEADTNLVSGESLIRQIIYGKRFMKEEFGTDNKILWLPDVFGYSAALPQILKKSGISQFFTTKLNWNETNYLPDDVFLWEGIDGSTVYANLIRNYIGHINPDKVKKYWDDFKNKDLMDESLMTFGFGDGGGGPTYEMLENHKRLKYGIPGMPRTVIKKASEHFDYSEKMFYENTKEYNRPRWVGEMYLELHRGTYTSMAKNKRYNRKSELLYQKAEELSVSDMVLLNNPYPEKELRENQLNILLNQFHDIIPGSSIKPVYEVTDKEYEKIIDNGNSIKERAVQSLLSSVNTKGGIFVYNQSPFTVSDYIELDGKTYYAKEIPAHGWKVIKDIKSPEKIKTSDKIIENNLIKVTFNDKYHIVSVFDKEIQREIIKEGFEANVLEAYEDYPKRYDAWEISSYYKQKKWIIDNVKEVKVTDTGIKIVREYQKSLITQNITLKPDSKRIDFNTVVDWKEDHILLKAAFPTDIHSVNASYDIQFGHIERPTHTNTSWDRAKFEVCAHKWADLSEDNYGVSILSDCKYGYNVEKNVMKISLIKCATYPNPDADKELHTFTYSLYPHTGNLVNSSVIKEGYLLNMPLEAYKTEEQNGCLSDEFSIVSSNSDTVVVETIKKAEDDSSIIVRLYEAMNKKEKASVTMGFDFKEAYLCDLTENNIKKIQNEGRKISFDIGNFEILTFKFIV